MNDNARKWVEALRSGEFDQAQETLRNPDGAYCCLGVACELYRREVGGEWVDIGAFEADDHLMEDAELHPSVAAWLGVGSSAGDFKGIDHNDSLIDQNDCYRATFAEIADIIESEPEGLFA